MQNNIHTSPDHCFHCGLDIQTDRDHSVEISGIMQPMCCAGCQAVAQAIVATGQSSFYQNRTAYPSKANELVPDFLSELKVYDNEEIQKSFVRLNTDDQREASLLLEGITCAACVWLNEKHLQAQKGVLSVQINYSTHRAQVSWDNSKIQLSDILASIRSIGYIAHPYDPNHQHALLQKERKVQLKRIGLAGILGMQIMIVAVALYLGDWMGIKDEFRNLLNWAGFVFVIPILLYSAKPFYQAAYRDIKSRRLGMDVPVALGISIAFCGSVLSTVQGHGNVYYDSIAMFVFFLLTARYFEFRAREYSSDVNERLTRATPAHCRRQDPKTQSFDSIPVAELCNDDIIKVQAGEIIPVDGIILEGSSGVNEALLTGESLPRLCTEGDTVVGGSVNADSPLVIKVTAVGQDTVLSNLLNLMEKIQTQKPAIATLANQIAAWFVSVILILAAISGAGWYLAGNEQWLSVVISLLVVTCPCALSLATPVAITAATGALIKNGLLITRASVLEQVEKLTDFSFDKTGTLTDGKLELISIDNNSDYSDEELITFAAALEHDSEHLLGKALVKQAKKQDIDYSSLQLTDLKNHPGKGVEAMVNGKHFAIGNSQFINEFSRVKLSNEDLKKLTHQGSSVVILSQEDKVLGAFLLGDELREGASELISSLKNQGIHTHLFTGDTAESAAQANQQLNIDTVSSKMTPEDKLAKLQMLQKEGKTVAMVGDGINDSLILAGADISIAMGSAAQIAKLNADIVLTSNSLDVLRTGIMHAKMTLKIIRQNLTWALMYNGIAIPAAALGYVSPWMAAIGMSLSSLLVVINSSRLRKIKS